MTSFSEGKKSVKTQESGGERIKNEARLLCVRQCFKLPSVPRHCWLGERKGIWTYVKVSQRFFSGTSEGRKL